MNENDRESLALWIRALPKAELHIHIEGSLEPELLFGLAERNGLTLPYPDVEAVRAAYSFTDLQSFLDIYYQGAAVLQTEQDFYDLMAEYLHRAEADGVCHAEIFFDPQTHTERGIGFDVFMPGFRRAIEDAPNVSVGLIMCFLRHLPCSAAIETFRLASDYLEDIVGVGLDSSEVGNPPEDFADVFALAAAANLRLVAHAGEEGPPRYIWGALDALQVERIDHGVRSEEDEKLLSRLVDEQIPLTMCPLSNLALRVVDDLADHNIARLLDRGLKVTINSDDPAYFGGYVADNYLETALALGLSRDQLSLLARNSIEASFASEAEKAGWMGQTSRNIIEGKPVLLVIDIQGGESSGEGPSAIPFMPGYQDAMDHAPALIAKARECDVPVVFFQEAHRRDLIDFGRELDGAEGVHLLEGDAGTDIDPALGMRPDDYFIRKRRYSCFFGTELEILLKGLKADTLILIGGHTDVCVHYTFVDAHQHDYYCRVVEDGVAGSSTQAHEGALKAMEYLQTGARRTSAEIIKAFEAL